MSDTVITEIYYDAWYLLCNIWSAAFVLPHTRFLCFQWCWSFWNFRFSNRCDRSTFLCSGLRSRVLSNQRCLGATIYKVHFIHQDVHSDPLHSLSRLRYERRAREIFGTTLSASAGIPCDKSPLVCLPWKVGVFSGNWASLPTGVRCAYLGVHCITFRFRVKDILRHIGLQFVILIPTDRIL